MPLPVDPIEWTCHCGNVLMLKPHLTRTRKHCSRECLHRSLRRDDAPTVAKPKKTYGQRECPICEQYFEAKTKTQKYCSQDCGTKAVHLRNIDRSVEPRPCEHCKKGFRPRPGQAGRFCSRPCTYAGSRGENAAHWRGGRHVDGNGYVKVSRPDHPAAHGNGQYVAEHRIVMEEAIGRLLESYETVHHINGQKDDNRIENLQLRTGNHGRGVTHKCMDCGSANVEAVPLK